MLLFRSDTSIEMGTGHLMRSFALAQAWKNRGAEALFITGTSDHQLRKRIIEEGFLLFDLEKSHPDPMDIEFSSELASKYTDSWVVLDGYHFDEMYQQEIKKSGTRLLVIDDLGHLKHYYADIILNQNLDAHRHNYSREPATLKLLGTDYSLLRSEFLTMINWVRKIRRDPKNIIITLGGSDPLNLTYQVVKVLTKADRSDLNLVAVLGASYKHKKELSGLISDSSLPSELIQNSYDMAKLMAWADVAVSAAGSTCWELAFMGLPSIVVCVADNQEKNAELLEQNDIVIKLDAIDIFNSSLLLTSLITLLGDYQLRQKMSENGRSLIDGNGSNRVLLRMVNAEKRMGEI